MDMEKKSYDGPLAWVNDIEVNYKAYFLMIAALVGGMVFACGPMVKISGYGETVKYALSEIDRLAWLPVSYCVVSVAAIATVLFPMAKFLEWKRRWFLIAGLAGVFNVASVLYFVTSAKDALKYSWEGALYSLLSVEVKLTMNIYLVALCGVLVAGCMAVILKDIQENERKYGVPLVSE